MDTLERDLVEKTTSEHGWENVLDSTEARVILGSVRHRGRAAISEQIGGGAWRIELPERLIQ